MRIILMRHGESFNNISYYLANGDEEAFQKLRHYEPKMSQTGNDSCFKMGGKLAEMKVKFNRIMCSGHRRALISAKLLREGYLEKM